MSIIWENDRIKVPPPQKPKKITGTHFAEVLGASPWATPFEAWCRCTRTYERPFEGNKYTEAGKIIEPKATAFLRSGMGYGSRVIVPEQIYGKNFFRATCGDFFADRSRIFGGMWDALIGDDPAYPEYVVEIKTVLVDGHGGNLDERWKDGKAPDYQALQASLYAYLLGCDRVMMVAVALREDNGDYDRPDLVTPSFANNNVYIDEFGIYERYPRLESYVAKARRWWRDHVVTGISPEFDSRRDAELLAVLKTNCVTPEPDIRALTAEAEKLKDEIDAAMASVKGSSDRLKEITGQIGAYAATQMRDGDSKVQIKGDRYIFTLTKITSSEIDREALRKAGLYNLYSKSKTTYRLTQSLIKEGK